MFEQSLTAAPPMTGRAWSALAGVIAQSTLLTAAVLVPIVFPDTLPRMQTIITLLEPPGVPPPPPARPEGAQMAPTKEPTRQIVNSILQLPAVMPPTAALIEDPPDAPAVGFSGEGVYGGIKGGADGGRVGGPLGGVLKSIGDLARPAPPVAATAVAQSRPEPAPVPQMRVGGKVQEAMIVRRVIPTYPPLAKAARISGVVQLVGYISTDGYIRQLQVTSGHPLLVTAALEAVRQWVYRPTLLNGTPVEVIAPITVTFTLN